MILKSMYNSIYKVINTESWKTASPCSFHKNIRTGLGFKKLNLMILLTLQSSIVYDESVHRLFSDVILMLAQLSISVGRISILCSISPEKERFMSAINCKYHNIIELNKMVKMKN